MVRPLLMKSFLLAVFALAALFSGPSHAQDKKTEKKDLPVILVASPLGVPLGATTKLTLRGLKLDEATEIHAVESEVSVKLVSKSKSPIQQQEVSLVGDSQMSVEVTLPAELADPLLALVVVTPAGVSKPLEILVGGSILSEQEPNQGFKQSQAISCPSVLAGQIQNNQDVDVFRYTAQAGERVVFEVHARRHGSALDATLVLYDEKGQLVAERDDAEENRDAVLDVTLAKAGVYYLSLGDAHDQGGAAHPYRLVIRRP